MRKTSDDSLQRSLLYYNIVCGTNYCRRTRVRTIYRMLRYLSSGTLMRYKFCIHYTAIQDVNHLYYYLLCCKILYVFVLRTGVSCDATNNRHSRRNIITRCS